MDRIEEVLHDLGFSKNEAKVYSALLELGSVPVGKITKISKVHRTNVYDSLDRLIDKGLVAYIMREQTKHYQATNPENLFFILKEKEMRLQSILPQLHFSTRAVKSRVNVFEGKLGIKNVLNGFLELGQPIMVFGVPKNVSEMVGPFLSHFHRKRVKKKIVMRHIYNDDAKERIAYLNGLEYTEARTLPTKYNSPVATNVCGNQVAMIMWSSPLLVIHIEDQKIADSYRNYFELLWKQAKI